MTGPAVQQSGSALEREGRKHGVYFTAAELLSAEFPEPRWAVPGLLAEGLNLLVGAPKVGKSWLCLAVAIAVAMGGKALGKIEVTTGPVLYAALEDTPRRLQSRLEVLLGEGPVPTDLHMTTSLSTAADAIGYLEGWLIAYPTARLVIVDVLRKVRRPQAGRDRYAEDYDAMAELKRLADTYHVAIVAVHHTRKATDESDVFNEVSGSTGLTGAADAILIVKRARNTSEAELHITGRDVTEHEYNLAWDADTCSWTLTDEPPAVAAMAPTRRAIRDHLIAVPGATPADVAAAIEATRATTRKTLRRMADDHQVDTDGQGHYYVSQVSQVSPVPTESDRGDRCDTHCGDCGEPVDDALVRRGLTYHPACLEAS